MATTGQTPATPGKPRTKPTDRTKPWTFQGIRIRPFARSERLGGYSYRVECGSKFGKQPWRQFPTWQEAEAHATAKHVELQNHGLRAFSLDDGQRSLADKAFRVLADAGLPAADLEAAVTFYVCHHRPEGGDLTVDQVMDAYLTGKRTGAAAKSQRPLRQRSLDDLETRLGIFAKSFGSKPVKDVTAADLEAWLGSFENRATRRNYHTIIGGFFSHALKQKLVGSSPLASLTKPAKAGDDEKEIGVLTIADAAALLEAACAHPELELGWFVALGLFTGARAAELERLAVADVKLDQRFLHIGPAVAKKRRVRNVNFAVPAVEETTTTGPDGKPRTERHAVTLDPASAWLAACPPPANGRVRPDGFRYKWSRLLEICGWMARDSKTKRWSFVRPWPANGLRHTFASMAYNLTNDAALVASRLGHADDGALLFEHYRALVGQGDGSRFFSLKPAQPANVVAFPATATATANAAHVAAR